MRRFDELQRAAAAVPDDLPLRSGSAKPTPLARERDPLVLRAVWARASAGATAAECEAAVPADAWRVRRLLAHWLSEGSLRPAEAVA
jgi:hypothetical protein